MEGRARREIRETSDGMVARFVVCLSGRSRGKHKEKVEKWTSTDLDWRDERWHGTLVRRQTVGRKSTQAKKKREKQGCRCHLM